MHLTPRPRWRRSVPRVASVLVTGLLLTASACTGGAQDPAQASPTATGMRARYHFTVPDHWKNDPQPPLFIDGEYRYLYLYNLDYPTEVGTSWRLATSPDNVRWADQGVAAPKKTNDNFDLWSGAAVVDSTGSAGFGKGAVVLLATQMDHPTPQQIADASGPQAQFLWYSTDGGHNFRPWTDKPVLPNPGARDFRDPRIVRDDAHNRWVMVLAEGQRIGFYTSPDLKNWTYRSDFPRTDLGVLECPDLFQLRDDAGNVRWVLGLSGNASATGGPNTYAYWIGDFDGTRFTPESDAVQWLDNGFDWYGAVTWPDPKDALGRRFAVGWMNNWAYYRNTPTWTSDGFNGTDSITRQIRLVRSGDGHTILSQPVDELSTVATSVTDLGRVNVDGHRVFDQRGVAYQLEADVSWSQLRNVGLQLRRSADGSRHVDVGVFGDVVYVNRGGTDNPSTDGSRLESHTPFDAGRRSVHLRILVDTTTVEVFVDDGRYVHSSQVFPRTGDDGIALFTDGGSAVFDNLRITEFADLSQRPAHVIGDFEGQSWGDGWTATGALVGRGPTASNLSGQVGRQVADTHVAGGDQGTGTVDSPAFTIDRRRLSLLIGGGRHPLGAEPATSVQLLVDGKPVRTATGQNDAVLRRVTWDVSDLAGKQAQIQILDDAAGTWGHLMVDQIVLAD